MNNLKENNIRKTLWHIKRHCKNIENNYEDEMSKTELFHLKSSVETLSRILNNEKPYPNLDREEGIEGAKIKNRNSRFFNVKFPKNNYFPESYHLLF